MRGADRSPHGGDECRAGKGFCEKSGSVPLNRSLAGPGLVEAGDEDDGRAGSGRDETIEQLEPGEYGKLDVEDQAGGFDDRGEASAASDEANASEANSARVSIRCIASLMLSSSSTITTA